MSILFFDAFKQGINGHCVSMPQIKIIFKPLDYISCLNGYFDLSILQKTLFYGKLLKVFRAFTGLRFNIVKISLK
jgi:hypothetical protein